MTIRSVLLAALLLLVFSASAEAAFPGDNGKIVFEESEDTWVTNGPRATPRPLPWRNAAFKRSKYVAVEYPEVVPDGDRALVTVNTPDDWRPKAERGQFLGLISLDGSVQTRLLSWPEEWGELGAGNFTPDGRRIAFTVYQSPRRDRASIFLMDADGTNVERLTEGRDPVFSPDGSKIAFSRRDGGTRYYPTFGIYSMGTDGSGEQRLARGQDPDFSPDGERIVFEGRVPPRDPDCNSEPNPSDPTISVMDSDGSDVTHLRTGYDCDNGHRYFRSPSFSPDGRKIVYAEQEYNVRNYGGVYVMNAEGSNEVRLPSVEDGFDPSYEHADWGPKPTGAASGQCAGRQVTIAGTGLADRILGTNGQDVIQARRGDDAIAGRDGRDRVCGGPGDDGARGGKKADGLVGGPGHDLLGGERGPDLLGGGRGRDVLGGGRNRDGLFGGKGFDRCFGGKGQDTVRCERSS